MPTLSKANAEARDLLTQTMAKYHGELTDHGVTIDLMVADRGENDADDKPPLKLHGWPAHAVVKINGYKLRVQGLPDATITLDGPNWRTLTTSQRIALLDHECEHLVIARDKEDQAKIDDAGRPKLKMRPHDWELGGFESVARRHKGNAPEVKSYSEVTGTFRQCLMAWSDDNAEGEESPSLTDWQDEHATVSR